MSDKHWQPLPNIERHCFACGPDNHHGLHMRFFSDGERIKAVADIPEHLRGWSNLAHGGVLTTLLDEAMAWAGIYFLNRFLLTKSITVHFKKPVYIEDHVTVIATIGERHHDRKIRLHAALHLADGSEAASADGDFVLYTPSQFQKLGIAPDKDLQLLQSMFSDPSQAEL